MKDKKSYNIFFYRFYYFTYLLFNLIYIIDFIASTTKNFHKTIHEYFISQVPQTISEYQP